MVNPCLILFYLSISNTLQGLISTAAYEAGKHHLYSVESWR